MRTAFVENLMDGLAFMVEKREEHAVLAWALFLDPRSGKGSMQYWQDVVNCQGKGTGMNEIVKFYWGLMIKVLVRLHQHRNPAWGHNQAPSPEQGGFLTSLTRPSGQGRRNNEKALHQSMEAQMQRFLLQPFTCSSSLPGPTRTKLAMQWLSEQRHLYPDVVALAQSVLVIPGTQMDNERLFSLAGILHRVASLVNLRIFTIPSGSPPDSHSSFAFFRSEFVGGAGSECALLVGAVGVIFNCRGV
eukprot:GHVU01048520.1.p1 GENE.GHVU01048520.1~~GHVU01048520.1.p1  ORF type:complete len:245 (+),score=19.88 GHVU01048520.1:329-1063(+)